MDGTILISISYSSIRYLKTPKHGFSFHRKELADKDRIDPEALMIVRVAGEKTNTNQEVQLVMVVLAELACKMKSKFL